MTCSARIYTLLCSHCVTRRDMTSSLILITCFLAIRIPSNQMVLWMESIFSTINFDAAKPGLDSSTSEYGKDYSGNHLILQLRNRASSQLT